MTTGILRGAGGGEDGSFGVLGGVLGACMNASDKTSASDNAPSAVALLKDSVIMPSGSSKSWLSGEAAITSMYKHETPLAFDRTTNKMLLQPGAQTATKGEGTVEGGGEGRVREGQTE